MTDIAANDFFEINTVKSVASSQEPNEFEFETRESVSNIKLPTSDSEELTIVIYRDPADTNGFVRLFNAKVATAQADKVIGLALLHAAIGVTPNTCSGAGNYIVSSQAFTENKSEGVEYTFTLTPYEFNTQGFHVPAA